MCFSLSCLLSFHLHIYFDVKKRPYNRPTHHERQFSSSSSVTTASRTTSPSPSNNSDEDVNTPMTPIPTISPGSKLRLRPCSLEDAEAVIVIAFPNQPTPDSSNPSPQQNNGRGMLVFGPAVEKFRNPKRPLAKNARVHPYQFVRNPAPSGSRRSSVISITAHPFANFQAV